MNSGRIRILLLMFTDVIVLASSWLFVSMVLPCLWGGTPMAFKITFSRILFPLGYVLLNVFARLYHSSIFSPGVALAPVAEFRRITLVSIGSGILFFAVVPLYKTAFPAPYWMVVVTILLNILLAQPARNLVRVLMKRLNIGQIPVVLLEVDHQAETLRKALASPHYGFELKGCFSKIDEMIKYARQHRIRHCISCQHFRTFRVAAKTLLDHFSMVIFLPELRAFPIAMANPVEIHGIGGLEMYNLHHHHSLRITKRISEVTLGLIAIAILLMPAVIIALILGFTGGWRNIFHGATRCGKKNRTIRIWKFRTMCVNAETVLQEILANDPQRAKEWDKTHKLKNDPRVTKFGHFLRKTSLDEIPQLWNVIRGEMALVGPRPIVQEEMHYYGEYYSIFSSVKPGITGLWQVSGRSDVNYDDRVFLDVYYVFNWSLWLDAWIFLQTFWAVISSKGAC